MLDQDTQGQTDGLREALPEPEAESRTYPRRRGALGRLRGVRLDPAGLTELLSGGLIDNDGERTTPWAQVLGVDWAYDHAKIRLPGRVVKLNGQFENWQEAAREIEVRAPHAAAPVAGREIGSEDIAGWLGIPVDGQLVCKLGISRAWLWVIGVSVVLLMIFLAAASHGGGGMGGMIQLPIIFFAMLASAESVRADVHGLSLRVKGKPQRYAWSEIESMSSDGHRWVVKTPRGQFSLSTSMRNSKQLFKALQEVVKDHNRGFELPDEVPMPEGALSRMTGEAGAEAIERGLSPASE